MTRRLGFVLACAALLGTGCAATASETEDEAPVESSVADINCEGLADEAVRISEGEDLSLIKVRNPKISKDRRETYSTPTGDKDELVLECKGSGLWSDGSKVDVLTRLTIDSDEEAFVYYEQVY